MSVYIYYMTNEQNNFYVVFDSMGRRTKVEFMASNMGEALRIAKSRQLEIGTQYYTVKRSYNTGVKAQQQH